MIGMLYMLYVELGETPIGKGMVAAVPWIIFRWRTGSITYGPVYYVLGWCVPLISLTLVWRLRRVIGREEKTVNWLGFLLVALCLLAHWAGVKTEHPRLSVLTLIGLLWSIPLFLFGWRTAKHLFFPCAYLVFCIPLNFLDSIVFRLRVLAARGTAGVLNGLGVDCVNRGTTILATEESGFSLVFQGAAAGLGTLLMVAAFAVLYGYVSQRGWFRMAAVAGAAVPAFVVANLLAMTTYGLLAGTFGQGFVDPLFGWVLTVFLMILSCLLVILTGQLMRMDVGEKWVNLKETLAPG